MDGNPSTTNDQVDHCHAVCQSMYKWQENHEFCDTLILTSTEPVYAHAVVLASVSSEICVLIRHNTVASEECGMRYELNVQTIDCTAESMAALLMYCYTGVVGMVSEHCVDNLYVAAQYLGIKPVASMCLKYIHYTKQNSPTTVTPRKRITNKTVSSKSRKKSSKTLAPNSTKVTSIGKVTDDTSDTLQLAVDGYIVVKQEDLTNTISSENNNESFTELGASQFEEDQAETEFSAAKNEPGSGDEDDVSDAEVAPDAGSDVVDDANDEVSDTECEDFEAGPVKSEEEKRVKNKIAKSQRSGTKSKVRQNSDEAAMMEQITGLDTEGLDQTVNEVLQVPVDCKKRATKAIRRTPKGRNISRIYKCSQCNFKTNYGGNLCRHKETHGTPYPCHKCGATFTTKFVLQRHLQMHEEPLHCDLCDSKFLSHSGLRKHLKRIHQEFAKYICNICNKRFSETHHFQGHMNAHLNKTPHKCDLCQAAFNWTSSLQRHIKTCKGRRKKKTIFPCDRCGKVLHSSQSLKDHLRGMHGESLLHCACGVAFNWRSSYNNHRRSCTYVQQKKQAAL